MNKVNWDKLNKVLKKEAEIDVRTLTGVKKPDPEKVEERLDELMAEEALFIQSRERNVA